MIMTQTKEQQLISSERNKEKIAEYNRVYNERNKEKIAKKQRVYSERKRIARETTRKLEEDFLLREQIEAEDRVFKELFPC